MSDPPAWKPCRSVHVKSYGYGYDGVVALEQRYADDGKPIMGETCWQFSLGTEQCGEEYATPEEAMNACDEQALSTARGVLGADAEVQRIRDREDALLTVAREALDEWEYAAGYKGEHLSRKHKDAERIATLRKIPGLERSTK